MADSLNDAFAELSLGNENLNTNTEEIDPYTLYISNDLRTITVPEKFVFGVYNDKSVLSVKFVMSRWYGDQDLWDMGPVIRVNFVNAAGMPYIYEVETPTLMSNESYPENDTISFEWDLDRRVFISAGLVKFNVCLRFFSSPDEEVSKEFNTTVAYGKVLKGLEIEEDNIDLYYMEEPNEYGETAIINLYRVAGEG